PPIRILPARGAVGPVTALVPAHSPGDRNTRVRGYRVGWLVNSPATPPAGGSGGVVRAARLLPGRPGTNTNEVLPQPVRGEPPRGAHRAVVRRARTPTRPGPDHHGQLTGDGVPPSGRLREVPHVTGRVDEDFRRVAREEVEGGPTPRLVGLFRVVRVEPLLDLV